MERSFTFEAKTFCLSAKDGYPLFRLEERRKGFVGYIFASSQCSSWLVDTVEAAILSQAKEEFAKSFREGDKVTMVHGGGNKAGRFLEVSVFAEGGRKGVIWLPEGRYGRGWQRFAGELRNLVAGEFNKTKLTRSSLDDPPSGFSTGRSFVDVLQSTPGVEAKDSGRKVLSSTFLDLFPVQSCFEVGSVGETRSAVDCAAMEFLPGSQEAAAASLRLKKRKGVFGISGLLRYLGHVNAKLDRVLDGLGSKPLGSASRPGSAPLSVPGLDPELGLGLDQGLDPVTDSVMDMNLELGSDLVDLEWALDSDPGLAFSTNSSFLVPDSVDALTRGSVGKMVTEADSKISVLPAAVSGGDSEGPADVSAPVKGSGCPPESAVEAVGIAVSFPAAGLVTSADVLPASPLSRDRDRDSPAALVSLTFSPEVVPASTPPDGVSSGTLVVPSVVVAPAMGCVGLPVSPPVFPVGVLVSPTEGVASISPVEAPVSLGLVGDAPASELVVALSDRNSIPAKGLIRRGFFGPSGIPHSQPEDDGSKGAPGLSSSVSKSQMGFSKRRKDKLAKQPPYSEEVLQAMKLAPFMGISVSGKDENKSLALLSAIDKEHKKDAAAVKREAATQRVKGLRELKNLDCSMVL
jgi:hypothetical protein